MNEPSDLSPFYAAGPGRLEVQTQIHRRGRVSQCPDGNGVRTGGGQRANIIEANPAGDLDLRPRADPMDRLLDQRKGHVVEKDGIGPEGKRLIHLVSRAASTSIRVLRGRRPWARRTASDTLPISAR